MCNKKKKGKKSKLIFALIIHNNKSYRIIEVFANYYNIFVNVKSNFTGKINIIHRMRNRINTLDRIYYIVINLSPVLWTYADSNFRPSLKCFGSLFPE